MGKYSWRYLLFLLSCRSVACFNIQKSPCPYPVCTVAVRDCEAIFNQKWYGDHHSHRASEGSLNSSVSVLVPKPSLGIICLFPVVELVGCYVHLKRPWNCVDEKETKKRGNLQELVMFPPGPYKNRAGLNSPHCICSIEEHGNITSRAFGKQLFGTKCGSCCFHSPEELPFAASSRRAKHRRSKQ